MVLLTLRILVDLGDRGGGKAPRSGLSEVQP